MRTACSLSQRNVGFGAQIGLDGELWEVAMEVERPLWVCDLWNREHLQEVLCRRRLLSGHDDMTIW